MFQGPPQSQYSLWGLRAFILKPQALLGREPKKSQGSYLYNQMNRLWNSHETLTENVPLLVSFLVCYCCMNHWLHGFKLRLTRRRNILVWTCQIRGSKKHSLKVYFTETCFGIRRRRWRIKRQGRKGFVFIQNERERGRGREGERLYVWLLKRVKFYRNEK